MATWIIGDIQGCYDGMMGVLERANFNFQQDHLWSVGDLVNRGPNSLDVLRFCKSLDNRFICTLGNHDLHMLAVARGCSTARRHDNFHPVIEADDSEDILNWLQHQPLIHYDEHNKLLLSHAGVAPMWTLNQALEYATEIETLLRSDPSTYNKFFEAMYGNQPNCWSDQLTDMPRARTITNYLTRMRFADSDGALNMDIKSNIENQTERWKPWFQLPHTLLDNTDNTLVIGHWAALEGVTNRANLQALDTGYIWGGTMTLMNAETGEKVSYQHG